MEPNLDKLDSNLERHVAGGCIEIDDGDDRVSVSKCFGLW